MWYIWKLAQREGWIEKSDVRKQGLEERIQSLLEVESRGDVLVEFGYD